MGVLTLVPSRKLDKKCLLAFTVENVPKKRQKVIKKKDPDLPHEMGSINIIVPRDLTLLKIYFNSALLFHHPSYPPVHSF